MFKVVWGIALIYPLLLGGIGYLLFKIKPVQVVLKNQWKSILIFTLFIIVFLDGYTIWHMHQEHFIYYWDFSGFWKRSLELNRLLLSNPSQLFSYIYHTINTEEYSSLPQFFLIFHTLIIGNTYPRFILAMVNSFLIPSQILYYIFILVWLDKVQIKIKYQNLLIAGILIFFTGNYLPLMLGYIASCGLIILSILGILWLSYDYTKVHFYTSILIGSMLVILVFLRRWFAYFVVSYFVMIPISYLIYQITLRKIDRKSFFNLCLNLFISGSFALLILLLGFQSIVSTFTNTNYAFAYQSVKYSGLAYAGQWFVGFYGWFQTFLILIGLLWGLKKVKTRLMILFCSSSIVFIVVLFYQVQVFGTHHYALINSLVLVLMIFGALSLIGWFQAKQRLAIILGFILLLLINFLSVFLPRKDNLLTSFIQSFKPINTHLYAPPRINPNVEILKDITTYLSENAKPYEYIYVLAGSNNISDDILRNAFLPEILEPLPTIESTKQLDTRDGIPKQFFNYTYLVIAQPIQTHNGADYQKVLTILNDAIINDTELIPYYFLEKEYSLEEGIQVSIYRRIEDIPQSIRQKYRDLFKSLYPDYPFLYEFE